MLNEFLDISNDKTDVPFNYKNLQKKTKSDINTFQILSKKFLVQKKI